MRKVIFFFQAEDGIRDIGVTGVQTCALPIWAGARRRVQGAELRRSLEAQGITVRSPSSKGLAEEAPFAYKDVEAVGDWKSVVEGKSVDLGGCRIIKKKNI